MTQWERVLEYIHQHGGITDMDAFRLGIPCLRERIRDLKQKGFPVTSEWITRKTIHGTIRFKRYFLDKGGDN